MVYLFIIIVPEALNDSSRVIRVVVLLHIVDTTIDIEIGIDKRSISVDIPMDGLNGSLEDFKEHLHAIIICEHFKLKI